MKRVLFALAIATSILAVPQAQVRFGDLNLNSSSELLFSASTEMPGLGEYSSHFMADIPGASMHQLTVFPERIRVYSSSGVIQIQNRFGLFRSQPPAAVRASEADAGDGIDDATSAAESGEESAVLADYTAPRPDPFFRPLSQFPAFVRGRDIQTGKTVAVGGSPDGRFLTYLEPTSAAYAELKMYDTVQQQDVLVSTGVELTLDETPLKWSPDSRFFVYSRGNELYYYSLDQYRSGRSLNESLRHLGPGTIESVTWTDDDTLYYVRGSLVYRIRGAEFFTRSLYQELLKIGTIVGKLPDAFDPNFDRFWISPDGEKILLSKDGRNITVLLLETDDYQGEHGSVALPYLYLPRNTRVQTVLWSTGDTITLLTGSIRHGEPTTAVYRLQFGDPDDRNAFIATDDVGVRGFALSPDGTRAVVWTDEATEVKTYASWETESTIAHSGLLHALWQGNTRLLLAGREVIERIDLNSYERARSDADRNAARTLLALSDADTLGFAPDNAAIRAQVGGRSLELTEDGWSSIATYEVSDSRVASENYRVYLENLSRGSYHNMVMVRNVGSYGTVPLFPRPRQQYEAFPERDQTIDLTNFSHGSRIRRREVALVFNAIDSVAGLTEILNTLGEYDLRATFFLNGDFIRRHPGAVREIADSGHEVGSLFFTYFDMADGGFRIDEDFVKQGLARNEDVFFDVTGEEVSLLWHAPYYFVNPVIIAASRQMNYAYIGRDVDSLDWVPQRDENGVSRLYKPATEIIEDVLQQKRPGSIIAMTVGRPGDDRPAGGRADYLFHRLDVLINGLIERGYDAVPVSTLMDNAR
ncbi:MAG: polysaccharide deacetylase family protein [Spirochaeta sp.]|nr:polysaccharide deacetylase family protein [Spirochaeta sp.]